MRSINPWQLSAPPFIQAPSIFIGNSYLKSYDFFRYQINLNYNYLFDIIMIMMLMPIHVGVPWLSFWLLSGSRAHRDTCVPPITDLWKFLGFKHCSLIHFHFHICYCYHRAELFLVSLELLFLSLNMNTTMRTQFLCAIYLVAFDKSSLGKLHTAEDTISWYMKWYRTRIHIKSFWKERKLSSYCFWF